MSWLDLGKKKDTAEKPWPGMFFYRYLDMSLWRRLGPILSPAVRPSRKTVSYCSMLVTMPAILYFIFRFAV